MLRGLICLCTLLAIVFPLSAGGTSLIGRRDDHIARDPSLSAAEIVDGDLQLAVESELQIEQDLHAARLLGVDVCVSTSVGRLVTGRRDRDSTHLDALLTCGRLLI